MYSVKLTIFKQSDELRLKTTLMCPKVIAHVRFHQNKKLFNIFNMNTTINRRLRKFLCNSIFAKILDFIRKSDNNRLAMQEILDWNILYLLRISRGLTLK